MELYILKFYNQRGHCTNHNYQKFEGAILQPGQHVENFIFFIVLQESKIMNTTWMASLTQTHIHTHQSVYLYVSLTIHRSEHCFFLSFVGWGQRTARMASSNTVFRPRWVKAEHSRYFTASIKIGRQRIKTSAKLHEQHLDQEKNWYEILLVKQHC